MPVTNLDLRLPPEYRRRSVPELPGLWVHRSRVQPTQEISDELEVELARRLGVDSLLHVVPPEMAPTHAPGWEFVQSISDLAGMEVDRSLVVIDGVLERLVDPLAALDLLRRIQHRVHGFLIRTPDRCRVAGSAALGPPADPSHAITWSLLELDSLLRANNLDPLLHGYVGSDPGPERATQAAFIPGRLSGLDRQSKRPSAIAYVSCFNELDIIETTIDRLTSQGMDVHVIDNWSNDGTWERLSTRYGKGPNVSLERFPGSPSPHFDLASILERTDALASRTWHDWILHVDADEQLDSFTPTMDVLDVLGRADEAGYDVVDFTLIEFRPEDPQSGHTRTAPARALPARWQFGDRRGARHLERAWRNRGSRVGIADSGGHVVVADKRVFPFNLVLRHYPLRSPEQARAKVFRDRLPRFGPERAARGWHVHYDSFAPDSTFLWPADDLNDWGWDALREWMAEFSTRVGIDFSSGRDLQELAGAMTASDPVAGPEQSVELTFAAPPGRIAEVDEPDRGLDQPAPGVAGPINKRLVVVVGMHRSGTSALTEALASTGRLAISAPDRLLGPAEDNPRGHFEDADFVGMNDWILRQHDSEWDDPWGLVGAEPSPSEVEELRGRWSHLARADDFLLKDPRLCLTLPWWLRVWPASTTAVVIVRHPTQVAQSLYQRNGLPLVLGELLWYEYVTGAIRGTRAMSRIWVEHAALMRNPAEELTRVLQWLEVARGEEVGGLDSSTIIPSLVNATGTSDVIIPQVGDLWRRVGQIAREASDWTEDDPAPLPGHYIEMGRTAARALHAAQQARQEANLAHHEAGVARNDARLSRDEAKEAQARLIHERDVAAAASRGRDAALDRARASEDALADVLASASWRITSPARDLKRIIRKQ